MGMYSLIEDARTKALDAANCWHECDEARELAAKVDAFERLSDRYYSQCQPASRGFMEGAREAEDALEDMRGEIICTLAREVAGDGVGDAYEEAWEALDNDAPPVSQLLTAARRRNAGDVYLGRSVA
jgi:hypothetical protein